MRAPNIETHPSPEKNWHPTTLQELVQVEPLLEHGAKTIH